MKPYPRGVIDLLPSRQGTDFWTGFANNPNLNNAWVDGFRGRTSWKTLEVSPGVFDFSGIDSVIALCKAHGKFLTLGVGCGASHPSRFDTDPTLTMIAVDYNEDGVDDSTMAVPFDPDYIVQLKVLIDALGAKYDNEPVVRQIFLESAGAKGGEFYVVLLGSDITAFNNAAVAAGFADKNAAIIYAVDHIFPLWKAAFPQTPLNFTSSNPWGPTDAVNGAADALHARNLAISLGGGTQLNNLQATMVHTGIPDLKPYNYGVQALVGSSSTSNFYKGAAPLLPWVHSQSVFDLYENAYDIGYQYLETYEYDLNDPLVYPILQQERLRLISNLPPGQQGIKIIIH